MKLGLIGIVLFSIFAPLYAVGVKAGTIISSQAQLFYEMDDKTFRIKSNKTQDIVDQLLDLDLSWLDSETVYVYRGQEEAILTFKLTNIGNGKDGFMLYLNGGLGVNFEVLNFKSFIDNNENARFDKQDILQSTTTLGADESRLIFVACDIPSSNKMAQDDIAKVILKAVSTLGGSGVMGKIHSAKGIRGVDAIDGVKGGIDTVEGIYKLKTQDGLKLKKSVVISNKFGTDEAIQGAVATYKIMLVMPKNKQAENIRVSDEIPKYTEYIQGSLKLDGKSLSDVRDSDEAHFDALDNQIIVLLDRLSYPTTKNIEFSVKLK